MQQRLTAIEPCNDLAAAQVFSSDWASRSTPEARAITG